MDISIIVTSYNYDKYIERCLRSLMNQTLDRYLYEIIVIDDSSTDHTVEILKNYKDEIRLIENSENLGLPASANIGIKSSRGQYIVRVDADDFVHGDFLYMLYKTIMIEKEYQAVACDYYTTNRFGEKVNRVSHSQAPIACGILYYKDALFDIGLYDEDMIVREDEELMFKFLKCFKLLHLPVALYRYRNHDKNLTKNAEKMSYYAKKLEEKIGKLNE